MQIQPEAAAEVVTRTALARLVADSLLHWLLQHLLLQAH
jgi:hypothetical protein